MTHVSRPTQFAVYFTEEQVGRLACTCENPSTAWAADWCRTCSVVWCLTETGSRVMFTKYVDQETGAGAGRMARGFAESDAQRLALSRLVALAYGHPEPLLVMLSNDKGEDIPSPVSVPAWVQIVLESLTRS